MNNCRVICIDDDVEPRDCLPDGSTEFFQVNDLESYSTVIDLLSSLEAQHCILLDLGLNSSEDSAWEVGVNGNLDRLSRMIPGLHWENVSSALQVQVGHSKFTLSKQHLDGISLIVSSLENPANPRRLFIIQSRHGIPSGFSALCDYLNENCDSKNINFRIEFADLGVNAKDPIQAAHLISTLPARWSHHYPLYSSDPIINEAVSVWNEAYEEAARSDPKGASGTGNLFCSHDHIAANPDLYLNLVRRIFGLKSDQISSESDLKCLLTLESAQVTGSHLLKPVGMAQSWSKTSHFAEWKQLEGETFRIIMTCISGLSCELQELSIRLPICPAIPFFLALRALIVELKSQSKDDHGETPTGILDINGTILLSPIIKRLSDRNDRVEGWRLSIPLRKDPDREFGLARRLKKKAETATELFTQNGVCGALWNVSIGRVHLNHEAGETMDRPSLLKLFAGADFPFVAVGFAPHFIHLYWS